MDNLEIFGIPYFKKGSGIHIKKENRGKFTDYCGGKVTNECIQRAKKSKNPKLRKRATFALNSRSWSKKHLEGGELSAEDSIRLLQVKPSYTGKDSTDEYFFKYFDFKKDTSDVADFFNSYLNDSKGIHRILNNLDSWWKSRHPYRKWYSNSDKGTRKWLATALDVEPNRYTAKMSTILSESIHIPKTESQRFTIVGTIPTPYYSYEVPEKMEHHPIMTLGHEYAHGKAPFNIFGTPQFHTDSAQAEALDQNQNTEPGHDSRQLEKHADNWGLKYLLYKEGIYDAREDKDITIEQIEKLRNKFPNLRPFKLMDNELLMFQINNVALNKSNIKNNFV